jgi:alpha-L-fucosidase
MDQLRPSPQQLTWQRSGFGLFFHFGINTFIGREHSDGTWHPRHFDPAGLDVAQWVDVAARAGAGYVVLTAKHHDGFCLWPTRTTTYSVRSSPWRGGRGDVVGELAAACRAAGMRLGLYLSPWDRNAPCYADPEAYDEFYAAQPVAHPTKFDPDPV